MVVNDNASNQIPSGVVAFFASKLAPTGSQDHLHLIDRFHLKKPSAKVRGFTIPISLKARHDRTQH
ncbi:hypothetical protein D3C75_525860 [compost metagenome]